MADLHAGPDAGSPVVEISDDVATGVSGLFQARYPEMVRLADLLGAGVALTKAAGRMENTAGAASAADW
jgi:hypothetical protein